MDNTALLQPQNSPAPHAEPLAAAPEYSPPEITLTATAAENDTDELPRVRHASHHAAKHRRPSLLGILAAAAGGAAGAYFALTLPDGADVSQSIFLRSGDFVGLFVERLLWGGAFLLAEYLCGFFALGWLFVWIAPLICGLGTGAALAAAFTAGTSAAHIVIFALVSAIVTALAAGTSQNMSSQLFRLILSPCGVVTYSPAAGEYTLRFLAWCGIYAAASLAECALRCAA